MQSLQTEEAAVIAAPLADAVGVQDQPVAGREARLGCGEVALLVEEA